MDTTRNVLQERIGAAEYDRLLSGANQISIFGEPVKELSREELLAVLTLTMQTNQEEVEQIAKETDFKHLPTTVREAGLW